MLAIYQEQLSSHPPTTKKTGKFKLCTVCTVYIVQDQDDGGRADAGHVDPFPSPPCLPPANQGGH